MSTEPDTTSSMLQYFYELMQTTYKAGLMVGMGYGTIIGFIGGVALCITVAVIYFKSTHIIISRPKRP